jgi:hypothetical protein
MRILKEQVPEAAVDKALQFISRTPKDTLDWHDVRLDHNIMQLLAYLPAPAPEFKTQLCEPQIVWDYLDNPWKSDGATYHVDEPPPWANGRKYHSIYAVALTESNRFNGGVVFKMGSMNVQHELNPGDLIIFDGHTEHVTGRFWPQGKDRIAVYFRFLEGSLGIPESAYACFVESV